MKIEHIIYHIEREASCVKPIIGIVEWPYIDKDGDKIYEVFNAIVECVMYSGGIPIGIFPSQIVDFQETRLRNIEKMTSIEWRNLIEGLKLCSSIIKPGALKIYDHERFIYNYALERDIPYLGICTGMQVMANYNKDYIEIEKNIDDNHHSTEQYAHSVKIMNNTLLKKIIGKDEIMVNSKHNNHLKELWKMLL